MKAKYRYNSIKSQFTLIIILVSLPISIIFSGIQFHLTWNQISADLEDYKQGFERDILPSLTEAVWNVNHKLTKIQLNSLLQDKYISGIRLIIENDENINIGKSQSEAEKIWEFSLAKKHKGSLVYIGTLYIHINYRQILRETFTLIVKDIFIILIFIIVISLILTLIIQKKIIYPFMNFAQHISAFKGKKIFHLDKKKKYLIFPPYNTEFKLVIDAYNQAVIDLQSEFHKRQKSENELKENELKLQLSLKEKELLLRELHHRTKNNMQVIISMLKLQKQRSENENVKTILTDSENRIAAMSLVHKKLYQAGDLSRLSVLDYVKDLVQLIEEMFAAPGNKINVNLKIIDFSILIDIAIPLGLILNELLTNAFKHAFPEGSGDVTINLKKDSDNVINLTVTDNGIGPPADFDERKMKSLGILTVISIARTQLAGQITFENKGGFSCHIEFKDTLYKERV